MALDVEELCTGESYITEVPKNITFANENIDQPKIVFDKLTLEFLRCQ